ncbi:bacillithiol biosynthesis cysteine-adding enzyme BshC [Alkalicoccus luteus]|uniref:Putative cysteine ligase BshC n=1 Tax=Alkalicoccus luteus TaxID=1237094 RepID=A0A969PRZ7_9BACI|nr:bacillithiol biosynthesis cysteine-adding enzyme BshC [Alkalicoccus luteus]NJP36454.1 bacillithiol biosynthesis cysteine-adding enzyme BshC [Alkalicoccus luteus]
MDVFSELLPTEGTPAALYEQRDPAVTSRYDYIPGQEKDRLAELLSRSFNRTELATVLTSYHQKYFPCPASYRQIERLREEEAVIVAGGQQAGLFLGPMYTVHKIISILLEADLQEKKLNHPVIPLFWIAGEDHDIEEINHAYVYHEAGVKKVKSAGTNKWRRSASETSIPLKEAEDAVREAVSWLGETKWTKQMYRELLDTIWDGMSYTEWFAVLTGKLFSGTGLVILDAHDPAVRKLEKESFEQLLHRTKLLQDAASQGAEYFQHAAGAEPVDPPTSTAHLFIHENGLRQQLFFEEGRFFTEQNPSGWTEGELLTLLKQKAVGMSNNVVTRPLMQDMLLPVLTFTAGAGELAYWGTLKESFHLHNMRMPVVKLRHSVTFLSRRTQKTMKQYELTFKELRSGKAVLKAESLKSGLNLPEKDPVFTDAYNNLKHLADHAADAYGLRRDFNERWESKFHSLLHSFEEAIVERQKEDIEADLRRLIAADEEVRLKENAQERWMSILTLWNKYGSSAAVKLLQALQPMHTETPAHFVIKE